MTEHELRAIFSANIKKYRNYLKLSQAELAEKLDISIPFLSDVENSRKWISPATLVKFACILGIEPYELFKPTDPLSKPMEITLIKWGSEVIQAVTETVKNIQEYHMAQQDK